MILRMLRMFITLFVRVCFSLLINGEITSSGEANGIALLKGEEVMRSNHTIPGCWLGGEFYLIGQRWSPVIEPYGLMICVKCQCASVVKHGVLNEEGKVMCRNIKYECPETRCPDPILRPNTCCKVCRKQGPYFEDKYSLIQEDTTEAENGKESMGTGTYSDMSALLVGSHIRGHASIRTRAVAICHVTLVTSNSFQYAIRFTRLRNPERILLMDKFGTVFQEQYIPPQRHKYGKLCGVWKDIPPVYMQYILQGRIYVTIGTKNNKYGEISGRLSEDLNTRKATFQGLLAPTRKTGAGGKFDIIYDVMSRVATFSINIENLRQRGIGINDFFVAMEKDREVAFQKVIRATGEEQVLTGKIRLDNELSRRISRARLYIRVTSRSGETLRGVVQPRLTCSSFIAALTRKSGINEYCHAAIQINEDSSLKYKIEVSKSHTNVREITLTRLNINRSIWKDMAILTHTYTHRQTNGGQAVGDYYKMRAIDTQTLLEEEVFVNIELHNSPDELRGRLIEMPYVGHIDIFQDKPLVLSNPKCDTTVFIWLVIDSKCRIRYHFLSSNKDVQELTVKLTSTIFWNKHNKRNVTEYTFEQMSGIIKVIPENVFTSLQFGENVIEVNSQRIESCGKMKTPLYRQNNCWSHSGGGGDALDDNDIETGENHVFRCYHNEQFYKHGESWQPSDHACFTCRCQRGNAICDKVLCHPTNCTKLVTSSGECCPTCEDENSTEKKPVGSCYFPGDKRWHPYGTTWHPYIPPLGYSKCAICRCIPGSAEVNCSRLPCPELDCPQSQRIRKNPDDCCQECRSSNTESNAFISAAKIRLTLHLATKSNNKKGCDFGDQYYNHGDSWHPSLTPFGEMKCYLCRCKHGETRCRKVQCKPLQCANKYRPAGQCCPVCLDDTQNKRRPYKGDRKRSRRSASANG